MATTVIGLKTFAASDPVDYNEINDNYNKIDNGVKTALQGRAAHNLLDNSDFRNPVNQRGQNAYQFDSGYTIDRWKLHWSGDGNITIHDGYIGLYRETYNAYLFQFPANVDKMVGKTYTVAAKVRYNGYIGWIDSTQRTHCDSVHSSDWVIITHTFTVGSATSDIGQAAVEICSSANMSIEMQWIALYEGSYTAETLPAYQPKGYAAELAECQWYFERQCRTFSEIIGNVIFVPTGSTSAIFSIKYAPKRVSNPTIIFSNVNQYRVLLKDARTGETYSATNVSSIDGAITENQYAYFRVNLSGSLDRDSFCIFQRVDNANAAYVDISADM